MGVRKAMGNMASSLSTWGLRHLAHRPAANMPGKIALKIDPRIIAESMDKITEGSIVVVGTNGKTTITNMIADALERQGKSIACNRTGANLAYGVATTWNGAYSNQTSCGWLIPCRRCRRITFCC